MRVALITGFAGQDGSYLADLLLTKNYFIYGMIRKTSNLEQKNISHLVNNSSVKIIYGDLIDTGNFSMVINNIFNSHLDIERLEIYNLAALSHVMVSFELPEYCYQVNGLAVVKMLETIKNSPFVNKIRFYQASTSELFGKVLESPQTEITPFYPRSPYAIGKLTAFWSVKNYREAYNIFSCNGILFNHESPRRDEMFVTRKITKALGKILKGEQDCLYLGNLDAKRDWGHAKDYVRAMWMMMQEEVADDYVICTSENHSVREFVEKTFLLKGIQIYWKGEGINEVGYTIEYISDQPINNEQGFVSIFNKKEKILIRIDSKLFRPTEVDYLIGNCTKAKEAFNWKPEYNFDMLVEEMIKTDCN